MIKKTVSVLLVVALLSFFNAWGMNTGNRGQAIRKVETRVMRRGNNQRKKREDLHLLEWK